MFKIRISFRQNLQFDMEKSTKRWALKNDETQGIIKFK